MVQTLSGAAQRKEPSYAGCLAKSNLFGASAPLFPGLFDLVCLRFIGPAL